MLDVRHRLVRSFNKERTNLADDYLWRSRANVGVGKFRPLR